MEIPNITPVKGFRLDEEFGTPTGTPTGTPVRGFSLDEFGTPSRTPQTPEIIPNHSASAHYKTPEKNPFAPIFSVTPENNPLAPVSSVMPEKDLSAPDFGTPPPKSKIMGKQVLTNIYPKGINLAGKNIILVFHGSYNPVNKGHIQLCKNAMSKCASEKLNVTRKIFSVADDESIRLKINKKARIKKEKREVLFNCEMRKTMIENALKEEKIDGVEIICHTEDNDRYTLVSNKIKRGDNDIIVMVGGSDWVDDKPDIEKYGICNSAKQCFPALIIARDESNGMSSTELQKCLDNEQEFCKLSYKSVYDLVKSGQGRVVEGGGIRWNENKIMYVRLKNSC